MSSKVRPLGRKSGFTLVELLIVVAIIGVLSTIGVPTFRRMIQKSKKTEAQVNLGGLYTAEQAFQSEYGAYGNNLSRMGFQIDGAGNSLNYVVGFMDNACNSTVTGAANANTGNSRPQNAAGDTLGLAIATSFPTYYTSGIGNNPNFIGPSLAGLNQGGARVMTANCTPPPAFPAGAFNGINVGAAPYNQFTAMAVGVIAPGFAKDGTGGVVDKWLITEARILVNSVDGVR